MTIYSSSNPQLQVQNSLDDPTSKKLPKIAYHTRPFLILQDYNAQQIRFLLPERQCRILFGHFGTFLKSYITRTSKVSRSRMPDVAGRQWTYSKITYQDHIHLFTIQRVCYIKNWSQTPRTSIENIVWKFWNVFEVEYYIDKQSFALAKRCSMTSTFAHEYSKNCIWNLY